MGLGVPDFGKREARTAMTMSTVARSSQAVRKWISDHHHVNWALCDQGMVSAVNFLTGILLARYLGIAEFGVFTLAWLAVEFVSSIQQSVIVAPMMSFVPKYAAEDRPSYFGAVILQQIGFAGISFVLSILVLLVVNEVRPDWRLDGIGPALGIAILCAQFQNFARRYFFTLQHVAIAFAVDFVRYAGQIVVLLWLLLNFDMNAERALFAVSACAAASTVAGCFFLDRVEFRMTAFREALLRHWDFSKWLVLSEVMRWGTANLFIVAAGAILGPAAVGTIRAAQNLVGLCHILFLGLENIVPVSAARHFAEGGIPAMKAYLKKMTWFLVGGIGVLVSIASVAPDFWLHLIYGSEYVGHGYLVRWWAAVYLIGMVGAMPVFGLRTIEDTKPVFWAYLVAAIFSVSAAYPFVAYLGDTGVMLGAVLVSVIKFVMVARSFFHRIAQMERAAAQPVSTTQ
jgi:O-antigen/teichoic acid export membrane protein